MLSDFPYLNTIRVHGVTGLVPIDEVTKGMKVVESLNMECENEPCTTIRIDSAMTRGATFLRRQFPNLDYINGACIDTMW